MASGGGDISVSPKGITELQNLARDLKEAGSKEFRKEFRDAGKRIGVPVGQAMKESAVSELPHHGGLGTWVAARMVTTVQVRLAGANIGVRFKSRRRGVKGLSDLAALNNGRARHPLFGDKSHWYVTPVKAGWIGKALDPMADDIRDQFLKAIDTVRDHIRASK